MAKVKLGPIKFKERVDSGYAKKTRPLTTITFRISPKDKQSLTELANELDGVSSLQNITVSATFRALIRHGKKIEKETLLAYITPKL